MLGTRLTEASSNVCYAMVLSPYIFRCVYSWESLGSDLCQVPVLPPLSSTGSHCPLALSQAASPASWTWERKTKNQYYLRHKIITRCNQGELEGGRRGLDLFCIQFSPIDDTAVEEIHHFLWLAVALPIPPSFQFSLTLTRIPYLWGACDSWGCVPPSPPDLNIVSSSYHSMG